MKKRKLSNTKQGVAVTKQAKVQPSPKMLPIWPIVLVSALPFIFSRQTMDPVMTPRCIFLSFLVMLIALFFFTQGKMQQIFELPRLVKSVFILLILHAFWSMLSVFFALNPTPAYHEISRLLLFTVLLFLIMLIVIRKSNAVIKLCEAFTIVAILQSAVGVLQYNEIAFTDLPGANPKPYGLMANRTLFGSAQVLLLPFVLYVFYKSKNIWKAVSIIALFGLSVSIVISLTRSAWIAVSCLALVAAFLIFWYLRYTHKKLIGRVIIITTVMACIMCVGLKMKPAGILSQSVQLKVKDVFKPKGDQSSSIYIRLAEWSKTWELVKDHPVVGVGPGNWKIAIPLYGREVKPWQDGLTLPNNPHNIFIEIASENRVSRDIDLFINLDIDRHYRVKNYSIVRKH